MAGRARSESRSDPPPSGAGWASIYLETSTSGMMTSLHRTHLMHTPSFGARAATRGLFPAYSEHPHDGAELLLTNTQVPSHGRPGGFPLWAPLHAVAQPIAHAMVDVEERACATPR
jgi:hypothetical protein